MNVLQRRTFHTSLSRPLSKSVTAALAKPNPPQWALDLARSKEEKRARKRVAGTPFLVGQKKVYLPKFTIALLRSPNLSPHWAQFEVPLSFNKLDMRDYLFHAYNVRTKAIRSFIPWVPIQRRIRRTKPGQRSRYRPKGIKKMTVEMEKPFVWPAEPEDYTPWDRERFLAMRDEPESRHQKNIERMEQGWRGKGPMYYADRPDSALRRQAERLLKGEVKWSTVAPETLPSASTSMTLPHRW